MDGDCISLCFSGFQAIYMFYALAIVCDDYFVPSLEKISEVSLTHRTVSGFDPCDLLTPTWLRFSSVDGIPEV